MTETNKKPETPPIEKWKIAVPALVALLSIGVNVFLYFDTRSIKKERDIMGFRLDSLKFRSDSFKIKSDSIQLAMNELVLKQKYPAFEVSYFQMSTLTYEMLRNRNSEAQQEKGLQQDHPLVTAKYLDAGIPNEGAGFIMVLMVKQSGGSTANDVRIDVLENNLVASAGFSFKSDIVDMFKNSNKTVESQLELGQLASGNSVIIPLFLFDKNPGGSHDLYSIKNKVLIPKKLTFTAIDGKIMVQPIREMLKNPFSITVDFDERG
jgi:hypothetical protein